MKKPAGVALSVLLVSAVVWAASSFDEPASSDTSQQFTVNNVQRSDTPNEPGYDCAEPDGGEPTCDHIHRQRYDLFGFASQITRATAVYADEPGGAAPAPGAAPRTGQPQISGFNAAGAWKAERGRPDVSIAVLDTGMRWDDGSLRAQVRLNRRELPRPQNCSARNPDDAYDCDNNKAFNVDDYAGDGIADGNLNGHLDGQDLIRAFSDRLDADNNGFVDDIAGWDFFDDDNDAHDASSYFAAGNHGRGRMKEAAEPANDGRGELGVCPKCQIVPIRIWDTFVSDGNSFGLGILYAADNGVAVIIGANGSLNHTAFTEAASEYAWKQGVVQTYSGDDLNTGNHNYPAAYNHAMLIEGAVPDTVGLGEDCRDQVPDCRSEFGPFFAFCQQRRNEIQVAMNQACDGAFDAGGRTNVPVKTYFRSANTAQFGGKSSISMWGATGSQNTGRAGGAAALVVSALKRRDDGFAVSADEVRIILEQTAEDVTQPNTTGTGNPDLANPGWDSHFGWGRANLGAAVQAAKSGDIPPEASINSPDWYAPLTGASVSFTGVARARRHSGSFNWKLEWGTGQQPTSWTQIGSGTSGSTVTDFGTLALAPVRAALASYVPPADLGDATFAPGGVHPLRDQFTVRLTVTVPGKMLGIDRKVLTALPDGQNLAAGYPKRLGSGGEAPIRYADLNGDNVQELIVPAQDGLIHAYRPDGSELPGWPVRTQVFSRAAAHLSSAGFASGAVPAPREPPRGPTIADLDNDGKRQLIIAAGQHLYVFNADGSQRAGFPFKSDDRFCTPDKQRQERKQNNTVVESRLSPKCGFVATPALAWIAGRAQPPVIVAPSMDGHLYVIQRDGSQVSWSPRRLQDTSIAEAQRQVAEAIHNPAIGDLSTPPDGKDDIVVPTSEVYGGSVAFGQNPPDVGFGSLALTDTRVYAVNGANGTNLTGWPVKVGGIIQNVLPFIGPGADPAIFIDPATSTPRVLLSATGTGIPGAGSGLSTYNAAGVKQIEMKQDARGGASNVTDASGGFNLFESAVIGDLLGTNVPAIVKYQLGRAQLTNLVLVGQNNPYNHMMGAWNAATGANLEAFPTITDDYQFLSSSTVAKMNPDPRSPTQQVVAGTGLGLIHAYDGATGLDIAGFPKITGGWLFAPAALSDSGRMAAITREGFLFEWNTGHPACQTEWPSFRHDEQGSGNYNRDGTPPYAVNHFAATVSGSTATLNFVATGDDAACGTATRYELRLLNEHVAADWLAGINPASANLPSPAASGTAQSGTLGPLTQGRYTVLIRAFDEVGNGSAPRRVFITIGNPPPLGNRAPVASFSATPSSGAAPLAVDFDAIASSDPDAGDFVALYRFDFGDGVTEESLVPQVRHTYAAPGSYKVLLSVEDRYGRASASAAMRMITVNSNSPVARLTVDPATQGKGRAVTLNASASSDADGDALIEYTFNFGDGSPTVTQSSPLANHVYAAAGSYSPSVTVRSARAGEAASAPAVAALTITNTAPTARFSANPISGRAPLTVDFDASASSDPDPGDGIAAYAFNFGDGGSATSAVARHTYTAPGQYTVTLTVQDRETPPATGQATRVIQVLGNAPVASLAASPQPQTRGRAVTLTASASDADGDAIVSYTFDFGDSSAPVTQAGASVQHAYARSGSYAATVRATDARGEVSAPAGFTVEIVNTAPSAALAANPQSGRAPLTVHLSADGSTDADANDEVVSYTFDFGDGTAPTTVGGRTVSHVYRQRGSYTARVVARDTEGAASLPASVTITAQNNPPVARLTATPASGTAPLDVNLDGSASGDADGDTLTYRYDFGDAGAPASGAPRQTHRYETPGVYTLRLTVTDSLGEAHAVTQTITVNAAAAAGGGASTTDNNRLFGGAFAPWLLLLAALVRRHARAGALTGLALLLNACTAEMDPAASANGAAGAATLASPEVTLSLAGSPLAENGGVAKITATLSRAATAPVTITLAFSGSATLAADYTRSGGSITIAAGALSGAITLSGVDDALLDPGETIVVDVDTVRGAAESTPQRVSALISDDDAPAAAPRFGLNVNKSGAGRVLSEPAGIDCGAACGAEFTDGESVSLSALPDAGSRLLRWEGACGGNGACVLNMSRAREVTAVFIRVFPLAVGKSGDGAGRVLSEPAGIDCGAACGASFDEGRVVTLKAQAAGGSEFTGWSGDCAGTAACTITMSAARTVGANFMLPPLTLRVSPGTVTEGTAGSPGTMVFTVTLSRAHAQTVTVNYATSDGSAQAGKDYSARSGALSFTPNDVSETVSVPLIGDDCSERGERFSLVLSEPVNAGIETASAEAAILDDDLAGPPLKAGAAQRVVSPLPPQYPPGFAGEPHEYSPTPCAGLIQRFYLGGFGLRRVDVSPCDNSPAAIPGKNPADGVNRDASVRVMVIEQPGGQRLAFVTLDAVGAGNIIQEGVKRRINTLTGIAKDNILFGQTHSHAGVDLQGLWGGVPFGWRQMLYARAGEAAQAAVAALTEADVGYAAGDLTNPSFNNYRREDPSIGTDKRMTLIQARRQSDGFVIGTVVQYSAHPTIIGSSNRKLHGDYISGVHERLEQVYPGSVSLYYNGPIADASPNPGAANPPPGSSDELRAILMGRALAERALGMIGVDGAGLKTFMPLLNPQHTIARLAITNHLFFVIAGKGFFNGYYDFVSPTPDPDARATPAPQAANVAFTTVTRVTLGRIGCECLEVVTIPGEASNIFGQYIRSLAPRDMMLLGLTHNSFGYIITEDRYGSEEAPNIPERSPDEMALYPAGYEEGVSLGAGTAPSLREQSYNPLFNQPPGTGAPAATPPSSPPPAAAAGVWLPGDLHVHDDHSSDGSGPRQQSDDRAPGNVSVADQIGQAVLNSLAWLPLTDHRTFDQHYDPLWESPDLLLLTGEEANGSPHANVIGAVDTVVQGASPPGRPAHARLQTSIWDAHSQGAVWSHSHPDDGHLNGDDTPNANANAVGADLVEVWNKASNIERELKYAENRWNAGFRFGIAGASDNHFRETWSVQGPGLPATQLFAAQASERDLLDALAGGRSLVNARVAGAPFVTLEADLQRDGVYEAVAGDEVIAPAGTPGRLRIRAQAAAGATLSLYQAPGKNIGPALRTFAPVQPDETFTVDITAGPQPTWYYVEARGPGEVAAVDTSNLNQPPAPSSGSNERRVITSPIFIGPTLAEPQPALPPPADTGVDDGAVLVLGSAGRFSGFPDVAAADGATHVVAEQHTPGRTSVVYRRIGADGRLSAALELAPASAAARFPKIAARGAQVWAAWQDERAGQLPRRPEIFLRHSSDGGASWQPEIKLRGIAGRAERPDLALDLSGRPVVAWQEISAGNPFDVMAQVVGLDAAPVNLSRAGKTVSAGNPGDSRSPRYPASIWPAVAVAPDGRIAVAFQDNRGDAEPLWTGSFNVGEGTDPDNWQILLLTRTGTAWSAPPLALGAADRADRHPAVGFAADGTLAVAWDSKTLNSSGANLAVLAALSTNGGASFSAPAPIAAAPEHMSQHPRLGRDISGRLRAVWYDSRSSDWRWRVMSAVLDAGAWSAQLLMGRGVNTWPATDGGALVFASTRNAQRAQRDRTQQILVLMP